ncbi:MAG: cysteine synthase A [Candidatus Gastranaerophilales bacterium]|nr:cysteine synthase A [Candidatus Gastranaerophilales bacterium]
MKIANNITDLIGNTPLLYFDDTDLGLKAKIVLKLESFNPGSSVKDRIALAMINAAEKSKQLKPNGHIIEPTSGNTGIGLAMVAAAKGYKLTIVMPDNMSIERIKLMEYYGANIILTSATLGMKGAIDKAYEIQKENEESIILNQFENPANPQFHFDTTGPEIWKDTDGQIDILVAGAGTGGTITGASRFLKGKKSYIQSVVVEPEESHVISGGEKGPHGIQGIGPGFVPKNLDMSMVDEVITVTTQNAIETAQLAGSKGISMGISSGAALYATIEVAKRPENKGKLIVVIIPDDALKYISTKLFEKE